MPGMDFSRERTCRTQSKEPVGVRTHLATTLLATTLLLSVGPAHASGPSCESRGGKFPYDAQTRSLGCYAVIDRVLPSCGVIVFTPYQMWPEGYAIGKVLDGPLPGVRDELMGAMAYGEDARMRNLASGAAFTVRILEAQLTSGGLGMALLNSRLGCQDDVRKMRGPTSAEATGNETSRQGDAERNRGDSGHAQQDRARLEAYEKARAYAEEESRKAAKAANAPSAPKATERRSPFSPGRILIGLALLGVMFYAFRRLRE